MSGATEAIASGVAMVNKPFFSTMDYLDAYFLALSMYQSQQYGRDQLDDYSGEISSTRSDGSDYQFPMDQVELADWIVDYSPHAHLDGQEVSDLFVKYSGRTLTEGDPVFRKLDRGMKMERKVREFYTAEQVAQRFGYTRDWLWTLISQLNVPAKYCFRSLGHGRMRFWKDEFDEFTEWFNDPERKKDLASKRSNSVL